jgi:hypothetical protein
MSADIALLCCIPLEEADWFERFASEECGDFVRSNAQAKFNGDAEQAWQFFSPEAAFIGRKLDALAKEHVKVVLRATTMHIREAAAQCKDVVVLAHWKHERVLRSDIRSPTSLWRHLLEVDPGLHRLGLSENEPAQLVDGLCGALDQLVLHGGSDLVAIPAAVANGRLPATVLRRDALNEIPYLAPGNRLETWDAMLPADQFSKLYGKGFDGTALMEICHSTLVAETFRTYHPDAICIGNRDPANAGLNLTKLDAAVKLMRSMRIPLWRALNLVGEMIDSLAT